MTGRVSPLTEKPVPLGVTCVMVTEAAPVLVKVSERLVFVPTWILPKAKLEGLGVRVPGGTPAPARLNTRLLLTPSAMVAKVMLPVKLPVLGGAKVMVAEVAPPGCRVMGTARLLMVKPAPLKVADVMLRVVPPLLERATVPLWVDPTITLPKTICDGLGKSFPTVAPTPVVGRVTMACELELSNEIVMVGSPTSVGEKTTLKEVAWPAARVTGKVSPVT